MAKKVTKSEPKTEKKEEVKPETKPVEVKAETKTEKVEEVKPAEDELNTSYTTLATKLAGMRQQMSSLIGELRTLQKRSERELKAVQKAGHKRKQRNSTRAPSGFVKPTLISDQLADFLAKPKGSMIARTDVTREINAYIRENKLQDTTNGRRIIPDAKLKALLTLNATDELTYFNLQRYMSQHFQKAAVVPSV